MLVRNQSLVSHVSWNIRKRVAGPVLRKLCKGSGVAVKLGQMLQTRTDLFDRQTLFELSNLQSNYDPLAYEAIAQVCFGDTYLKDNILSIAETPLGSASIAQVHLVQLKNGGPAVVKVKRPGLEKTTLEHRNFVQFLTSPFPNLNNTMMTCFDLFLSELDFQKEADNMREFAELSMVCTVPRVLYASNDVLLLEYVPGVQLSKQNFAPQYVINKVVESYLAQIFVLGSIHGDPHPGNLSITERGELVLYDFGCCIEVKSPEVLIVATLLRNAGWLQTLLEGVGYLKQPADPLDRLAVAEQLDIMLQYISDCDLQQLHEKLTTFPQFTQDFMLLLRVFSSIEGLCKGVDPNFKLDSIIPDLRRHFGKVQP